MRVVACCLLCIAAYLMSSCAPEPSTDALATYVGGEVTTADVDRALMALSDGERSALYGDTSAQRDLVREIVVDRLLLDEARAQRLQTTAQFKARVLELERDAMANLCMAGRVPDHDLPSEDHLRSIYQSNASQYRRPERRLVYHIFLRHDAGSSREQLRRRADAVRQRLLAGESFALLAQELSESESRHRGGYLGWLAKDECPGDLGEVVFGLDLKVPSAPVGTRDGVHLFQVENVIEAKHFSFEELRHSLRQQEVSRLRHDAFAALTDGLDLPPGSVVADQHELVELLTAGEPDAVLLRVGDYELRVGSAVSRVEQLVASGDHRPRSLLVAQLLATTLLREKVCLACTAEAWVDQGAIDEAVGRVHDDVLTQMRRRTRLLETIDQEPARLDEYFERNKQRFASPVRMRLRRVTVPAGADPSARMATLERWHREQDANLDELRAELQATIHDLGWVTVPQLRVVDPRASAFVADLDIGDTSPPYHAGEVLTMVQMADRQAPRTPDLDSVRDRVRQAYLDHHLQQVYREMESDMLREVDFRILTHRLSRLIGS
jgi:hypothetical protein